MADVWAGVSVMVMLAQQVITGWVASTTVTVCVQVLVLPQQSVACQMHEKFCEHRLPFVTVLSTVIARLVQQASVAVGGSKVHAQGIPSSSLKTTPPLPLSAVP